MTRWVAVERWPWSRVQEVKLWLVENFGVNGGRWGDDQDYDLENIWMDEDVYTWFMLKFQEYVQYER